MIVGISGLLVGENGEPVGSAGAGKDTLADILVSESGFKKIALADPLKRISRDVYAFTDEQLWGPSHQRNAPDKRYPRPHTWVEMRDGKTYSCACCGEEVGRNGGRPDNAAAPPCFLTARYALQLLGSEWGRECFPDTWVEVAARTAKTLLEQESLHLTPKLVRVTYTVKEGLVTLPPGQGADRPNGVAISDVRFKNEVDGLRARGAKIIRVKRRGAGLANAAGLHQSERESVAIPDGAFDAVIDNNGSIEDLRTAALALLV